MKMRPIPKQNLIGGPDSIGLKLRLKYNHAVDKRIPYFDPDIQPQRSLDVRCSKFDILSKNLTKKVSVCERSIGDP